MCVEVSPNVQKSPNTRRGFPRCTEVSKINEGETVSPETSFRNQETSSSCPPLSPRTSRTLALPLEAENSTDGAVGLLRVNTRANSGGPHSVQNGRNADRSRLAGGGQGHGHVPRVHAHAGGADVGLPPGARVLPPLLRRVAVPEEAVSHLSTPDGREQVRPLSLTPCSADSKCVPSH